MTVAFALLFGGAFGSFINATIDRIARGKSLQGRSYCDACGRRLRLFELLPVLSYVALRGRCAGCGAAIGMRVPILEASCAIAYALAFAWLPALDAAAACACLTLACMAIGILAGRRAIAE